MRKHGFTLVEIVVGIGLSVVLMVFFLTIVRGGSRESSLSSDHFTSAMLSQKAMENLMEEVDLNPLGMSALGIEESSPLPPSSVVDGKAPFFKYIEDRAAPWGQIDPESEGMIDSQMEPLYSQVKHFTVSATGKRLTSGGATQEMRHLLEAGVRFDWRAKVGKGNSAATCYLFSPVGAKPASISLAFDATEIEREAAATFFNAPGTSLSQLTTDSGANFQTVFALGKVQYASVGFINSPGLKTFLQTVTTCKASAQGSFASKGEEYLAKQNLAKAHFDLANACFQMTLLLASDVAYLKDNCETSHLGSVLTDQPDVLQVAFQNYLKIYATFLDSLAQAKYGYQSLLAAPLAGARGVKQQMFVIKRLFDIHRILAVSPDHPNGVSEYNSFLNALGTEMEGRNPFLSRLVLQEKGFAAATATLIEKHPFLSRVQIVTAEGGPTIKALADKYPSNDT